MKASFVVNRERSLQIGSRGTFNAPARAEFRECSREGGREARVASSSSSRGSISPLDRGFESKSASLGRETPTKSADSESQSARAHVSRRLSAASCLIRRANLTWQGEGGGRGVDRASRHVAWNYPATGARLRARRVLPEAISVARYVYLYAHLSAREITPL